MNLQDAYNQDKFLSFLKGFIPGFNADIRSATATGLQVTENLAYLGESRDLDLSVFELTHKSSKDARVKLAMDGFRVMKDKAVYRALIVYRSEKSDDWRLSLMTATLSPNKKGKIAQAFSNPRRFSFFLGPNAKINTPTRFIVKEGAVKDFEDLQKRFSLEVVNREFYKGISESFVKLVGGTIGTGKNKKTYNLNLKLPSSTTRNKTSMEFAVRLIGRIIFCWFLREKKGQNSVSLMPKELLSSGAILRNSNYYHSVLEPIFFEVLNKENKSREEIWTKEPFSQIPYLNGGLFSPQYDDHYDLDRGILVSRHINTLVIPDTWFIEFFDILESYNFTIDENTSFDEELSIDPEMLGRIFENLLAEINPETGESARKSTGSFYTPRTIVDYMVDESLVLFLKQKTGIKEENIRALISYDLTDDEQYPLADNEKQKIIDALEQLKLLDPACGSGAFPMGALQKIVFILQSVDPDAQLWFRKQITNTVPEIRRVIEREFKHKNFDYIRKLGIIRENIYGVDIQAIAIEISRLRCFLTLVVDERIDESLENRGIQPLPNLDFKFVVANSLIGLKSGQEATEGLFKDQEGISMLRAVREQYFNATNSERYRLQNEFNEIQKQMLNRMIQLRDTEETTHKLSMWEPFSNKLTPWFDPEWMFGIQDGFSILISNPPYVRQEIIENKDILKKEYEIFNSVSDLYTYFYERGIKLLKKGGTLAFITSNKFLRARYGVFLRKYLQGNTAIKSIVNFGNQHVFEAITNTLIFIAVKDKKDNNIFYYSDNTIEPNKIKFEQKELQESEWTIEEPNIIELKKKIEKQGVPLIDWPIRINRGLLTGYNEAYVIDEDTKNDLIKREPKSKDLIKSIIRGRDIERYFHCRSGESILYIPWHFPLQNDLSITKVSKEAEKLFQQEYPVVFEYLNQFKDNLSKRNQEETCIRYEWYAMQRYAADYIDDFKEEKVIWIELTNKNRFSYSGKEEYILAGAFLMTGKSLKYLLAFLNSKLCLFYFSLICNSSGMATIQWKKFALEKVPILKISEEKQKPFIDLVDKILDITKDENYSDNESKKTRVKEYENQIDEMVYKLYDLTPEEIEIIKNDK